MPPTLSQLQAWDIEHLVNAANYWTKTADEWEDIFTQMRNQAHSIPWEGEGGEALRTRASGDLATVTTNANRLRKAARIARAAASDISAAQRRVMYGVEDAQNDGFQVGEDLSVTDSRTSETAAEQAARQAQAQAFAGDINHRAAQLLGLETDVSKQLTVAAGDVGTLSFSGPPGHTGVQLVDFTQNGGTPPNLPQPLKDFINFQIHGKPLPPMTGPPITEIENRIKVIQQTQEWQQWLAAHPDQHLCGTADIMKALGAMAGGDLSLLAGAVGAPETFTASFWVGLMGWAAGQATAIHGLAKCVP
ncbi:hypothetical protein [Mycobacterium decipiens]|uniref:Uncharacterized protein n=1 Tax=Mycobacterium decipiens TaxID=1430326 RepID=A0A1X2LPA9_9MYCO|nr:hypothetical protein [Mycobacterium decipiens]OSC37022.1 hypothetical protein B8W66_22110 [Mycobacterium decipiens]